MIRIRSAVMATLRFRREASYVRAPPGARAAGVPGYSFHLNYYSL
jgi:hypothetical protein